MEGVRYLYFSATVNLMTPEEKNCVKLKGQTGTRPKDTAITRTYSRHEGKIHYLTPKPLGHNQSERKGLFYIYSERRGDRSKGK